MNKIAYIQSLRNEDVATLRKLVEQIWLETDSFAEYLMLPNSKECVDRLITNNQLPTNALAISMRDGSFREEDPWVGIWNTSIFSMCDADYHRWLLELCFTCVFRQALIDCKPIILKNRNQYPIAVTQYVTTNQTEKPISNEENRKRIKRVVHLPASEF